MLNHIVNMTSLRFYLKNNKSKTLLIVKGSVFIFSKKIDMDFSSKRNKILDSKKGDEVLC